MTLAGESLALIVGSWSQAIRQEQDWMQDDRFQFQ